MKLLIESIVLEVSSSAELFNGLLKLIVHALLLLSNLVELLV